MLEMLLPIFGESTMRTELRLLLVCRQGREDDDNRPKTPRTPGRGRGLEWGYGRARTRGLLTGSSRLAENRKGKVMFMLG